MAIIKCNECDREISDKAISCPHCGYPLNENETEQINNKDTQMQPSIPKGNTITIKTVDKSKKKALFIFVIVVILATLICVILINYIDVTSFKPVIQAGSIVEEDFLIYNNKSEVVMKPSDKEDGTILILLSLPSEEKYFTARGISIGDSIDKLGAMYGTITPKYNSMKYSSDLNNIRLDEFVKRYNEFKADSNITVTFDDGIFGTLYGRLEFTIDNGKITTIRIRNPASVKTFDKKVQDEIDKYMNK